MTPEERQLVRDLFDRLAELERERRDPDAENLIREGLVRAPHAIYALVQTALLQDEGLRAANDRITELEDQLSRAPAAGQAGGGSFLGERRGGGKWNTGEVIHGSVPPVRPADQPMGAPPGYGGDRGGGYNDPYRGPPPSPYGGPPGPPPGGPGGGPWRDPQGYGGPGYGGPGGPGGPMPGGPGAPPPARGGSGFLGTAAAVAAGAIGGSLLMGGIRSAMGSHGSTTGPHAGAVDQLSGRPPGGSPGAGGELSRDAGLNDVGGRRAAAASQQDNDNDGSDNDDSGDDDLDHDDVHDSYDDDNS